MTELIYYMIAILFAGVALLVLNVFLKKFTKTNHNWIFKGLGILLAGIFVTRVLSADIPLESIFELGGTAHDSAFAAFVSLTLTWFSYAAVLVTILYPFFKIKNVQNLVKYFVLPVAILDLVFLRSYTIGIVGLIINMDYRGILLSLEIGFMLTFAIQAFITSKTFKMSWKEFGTLMLSILGVLIVSIPAYTLRGYFGNGSTTIEIIDFTVYHRIALYAAFIIPFTIWYIFRNKEYDVKRFAVLFLSLAGLLTFSLRFKFDIAFNLNQWPLHLCYTAMYIVPLTLIFKTEKVFYFTFFINVLGALLAMLMPNYGVQNITGVSLITFWVNHLMAFFMPLLIVALRIYPRPKLKQFKYSTIAFTVYFFLILIINAWLTNYGSVDFFFTNSDFIAEKLGLWAENLRNITWTIYVNDLTLVFYPVYQLLFYLVYVAAAFGMWFIYEQFYLFSDQLSDMGKRKKQLKMDQYLLSVALNGRGVQEPMNKENENKLVLKNFTKKYGNSEVFAVKDANLVVNGGEIFGFLGPNGAGKSTIIKSIVGIQPITSGSMEVWGYDVDKQSVQTKRLIGFVPDHYALYEKLTGREYINYIADLYEVSLQDRNVRIEKYVKAFELENAFDNQMKTYSHGMKQKIAIMSALVHDPKLWILDEPLTGLDPTSIFQVKEAMKQHAERGNIVFFSSHIIDVVERLCDRIAIIKKGQIKTVVSIKELEEKGILLEDFYLKTIGEQKKEIEKSFTDKKPSKTTKPTDSKPKKANSKKQ